MKPIETLTLEDCIKNPVWEYAEKGETLVSPVIDLPVDSLDNRIIGTQFKLANHKLIWGTLSNFSLSNYKSNANFLLLSVIKSGNWFHLARYFDVDYDERGPEQLAAFLQLDVKFVFPIKYDLSNCVIVGNEIAKGEIQAEPNEELSTEELISLSLES